MLMQYLFTNMQFAGKQSVNIIQYAGYQHAVCWHGMHAIQHANAVCWHVKHWINVQCTCSMLMQCVYLANLP